MIIKSTPNKLIPLLKPNENKLNLKFITNTKYKSGISHPNSGIHIMLLDEDNKGYPKCISGYDDKNVVLVDRFNIDIEIDIDIIEFNANVHNDSIKKNNGFAQKMVHVILMK